MFVRRTLLFVPGDRPDRVGRAIGSDADAVAVDLEDAVVPGSKAAARDATLAAVSAAPPRDGLFLRVNHIDGPEFDDDLATLATLIPHLAGVLLPKVENAEQVRRLDELIAGGTHGHATPGIQP